MPQSMMDGRDDNTEAFTGGHGVNHHHSHSKSSISGPGLHSMSRPHQTEVIQSSASSTYSTELSSTDRNSLNEAGDTFTASTSQASIHDTHGYHRQEQDDFNYYDPPHPHPYPISGSGSFSSYSNQKDHLHNNNHPLIPSSNSEIDQAPSSLATSEQRTSATISQGVEGEDDMNFFSFSRQAKGDKQQQPPQPAISSSTSPSPDSSPSVNNNTNNNKRFSLSKQQKGGDRQSSSFNKRISIVRNTFKGNRESIASISSSSIPADFLPRNLDSNPHGTTPQPSPYPENLSTFESFNQTSNTKPFPRATTASTPSPLTANHARFASESNLLTSSSLLQPTNIQSRPQSTMSFSSILPNIPNQERHGSLALPTPQRGGSGDDFTPKSPNRFTNFFGWGPKNESAPPDVTSPTYSPKSSSYSMKNVPPSIDVTKANSTLYGGQPSDSGVSLLPSSYDRSTIEAMEEEIRAVSADLAASIRREMDLEDLVERLETEASLAQNGDSRDDRRTSDYFSDMGTPVRSLDGDGKEINLERIQRKAEQERANIRLEMMAKVEDERRRRKAIETHVRDLEQQVQKGGNLSPGMPERIRELESQLEEARRKLSEERKVKENFEDLLVALRQDIEDHRNERDQLRDEVVPRLRAKVQNLEAEKEKLQKMTTEHSKMERELQNLRNENAALASAQRQIFEMKHQVDRQNKRASIAIVTSLSPTFSKPPSMNQSGSMTPTERPLLMRDNLAEKLKDVEAQRDALHKALKSLRERQDLESKRAKERIKLLELERDKALAEAPGRHNREVRNLRAELDKLRIRAEDAVEKGFIVERSLGSVKMDLDRAEEERGTLRGLLRGHEVLLGEGEKLVASHQKLAEMVERLKAEVGAEEQWRNFSGRRELVLGKVAELESKEKKLRDQVEEAELQLANTDADNDGQIERLKLAIARAEEERETAVLEAEAYKERAEYLEKSEAELLESERSLAEQLTISAERVESLASQLRLQLDTNNTLRIRLADAIARGEAAQRTSAARINSFQLKLQKLQERLIAAQHTNEELVEKHEEEILDLKQSHTSQLRRLQSAVAVSRQLSPSFPLTPRSPRSPRVAQAKEKKADPRVVARKLEDRIVELERALGDADAEMEEVVGRMTEAQMMALELQGERDEVRREMRRLVREVKGEEARWTGF